MHWSTYDQFIDHESLLTDTLIQFFFPLWFSAKHKTVAVCHGSLGYLNLTSWLCFGYVTGKILLVVCWCG